MTRIELQNENGRFVIELNDDQLTVQAMFDDLWIPLLLAAGFQPETISDYLGERE